MTPIPTRRQPAAARCHPPRPAALRGVVTRWLCVGFALLILRVQAAPEPFLIQVVEKGSGWPVPLVELRTTHQARFLSDNNGRIAFDLPELMGTETWFEVVGHGYQIPPDGFGYRGVRLTPKRGGQTTVEVTRTSLARRLGRITGAGLFAEGEKVGIPAPLPETGVLGCDTVQTVVHGDRLFWLWGDTTLARYPLGIFHSIAAFTGLRPLDRPEPPLQLRWQHVAGSDGKPRAVADLPGSGPTWITACASLPDRTGQRRLVASYMKIKPPLEAYEWGLCIWDETAQRFGRHRILWTKTDGEPLPPPVPDGHAVDWVDPQGRRWVYFGNPFPRIRCEAKVEAWEDPARWERLNAQTNVAVAGAATAGKSSVRVHSGSIAWSPYRARWVTVFMEAFGKPSAFGELWYAEADAPTGPWGPAVKVLSHENYTFYNPRLHPELLPVDSKHLLFEGTYTQEFADRPPKSARHDYNQVMYRLDLDDPGLREAQAPRPQ